MNNEEFYVECERILGVPHEGAPFPFYKRTRWNNRVAGRGRYPGKGIIRCFGSQVHIALTQPTFTAICSSKADALNTLNSLEL